MSSIELTLLRPTLVYGGQGPSALDGIRSWLERRSWVPVAGNGLGQRMDLVVDDAAARERLGWNPRPFRH